MSSMGAWAAVASSAIERGSQAEGGTLGAAMAHGGGGSWPPQVNGWDESNLEEGRIRMVAARKGG